MLFLASWCQHRTILETSKEGGKKIISLKSICNQRHPSLLYPATVVYLLFRFSRGCTHHPFISLRLAACVPHLPLECAHLLVFTSFPARPSSKLKKPIPTSRSLSFLTVIVLSSLCMTWIMHSTGLAKRTELMDAMLPVHWKELFLHTAALPWNHILVQFNMTQEENIQDQSCVGAHSFACLKLYYHFFFASTEGTYLDVQQQFLQFHAANQQLLCCEKGPSIRLRRSYVLPARSIQKVIHHYSDTAAVHWGFFILLYIFSSRRNQSEWP